MSLLPRVCRGVSVGQGAAVLTYADVCRRMPTYADLCSAGVSLGQGAAVPTYADVCRRMPTYADVCSAGVSLGQGAAVLGIEHGTH